MTLFKETQGLRTPVLAWLAIAAISIFLHGPLPLYSTRTIAVAWEMWDKQSWIIPIFNGAPYTQKTPFLQWFILAGWALSGVNDIWPRILQVLLSTTVIVQTGMLARRLYPERPHLPIYSAWALAGIWYFFMFSLQIMYELLLTVTVLGGLLALCRREGEAWRPSWIGLGLAIGLGLLAKGPVILIHLGVPLLTAPWWHPAAQRDRRAFFCKAGLAVAAGIGLFLIWLGPALMEGGAEYRQAILVKQTAGRIHDSFAHAEPFWWYLPILLIVTAPWSFSRWWWSQVPALWRDTTNRFAWLWLIGVMAVFSAISGKLPYYLLPSFPAIALLIAAAADRRPLMGYASGGALLLLGFGLIGARLFAAGIGEPYLNDVMVIAPFAGVVLLSIGAAMLRWRTLPVHAAGILLGVAVLHATATPLLKTQFDFTPTAKKLGAAQRVGVKIAYLGKYQAQFQFAGRLHDPITVIDDTSAMTWAAAHPDDLIVVNTINSWPESETQQPVIQQPFRTRWIQVWRAGKWRNLPAQQRSRPPPQVP